MNTATHLCAPQRFVAQRISSRRHAAQHVASLRTAPHRNASQRSYEPAARSVAGVERVTR
jgi:hypothetical protein